MSASSRQSKPQPPPALAVQSRQPESQAQTHAAAAAASAASAAAAAAAATSAAAIGSGRSRPSRERLELAGRPRGLTGSPMPQGIQSDAHMPGNWLLDDDDKDFTKFSCIAARSSAARRLSEVLDQARKPQDHVPWIRTCTANIAVALVIVASAVLTGVEVEIFVRDLQVPNELEVVMVMLHSTFLIVFVVELALNIHVDGLRFVSLRHPAGWFGCFDCLVIVVSILDLIISLTGANTGALRVTVALRLCRLMRLLRLVKVFLLVKEFRLVFRELLTSITSVFWGALLGIVVLFIGSLFCVILLVDVDGLPDIKQYFGSVQLGLFTHLMIVTLESWPDVSDSVMQASRNGLWAVYFIIFILVTSFGLVHLSTGIVCEKLIDAGNADQDTGVDQLAAYEEEAEEFRKQLESAIAATQLNRYSTVNPEDLGQLLARPDMVKLLERNEIVLELTTLELFDIMDTDNSGNLSFNELVQGLLRLRGCHGHFHALMLQHDVAMLRRRQLKEVHSLQHDVKEHVHTNLKKTGQELMSGLEDVETKVKNLTGRVHANRRKAAEAKHVPADYFEDSALAGNIVDRFQALIKELDSHCSCADELLTPAPKEGSRTTGVSQGAQTDASIDFIEGLAPLPAFTGTTRALLAM